MSNSNQFDQYINGAYLEKVKDWHVGDSAWKATKVYEMIVKHQIILNSIYDIGCGAGIVLHELQKKINSHIELIGFDISPQAISMAKINENANLNFHNQNYFEIESPIPDLVLLLDVFEHIPDYISFLNALRRKSKWVIFHIPLDITAKAVLKKSNWMLYMRNRYGHLHYFTKDTAVSTLSDIGFKIIDYFYTDDLEISMSMLPETFKEKIIYEIRKYLFRLNPDMSTSIFEHYNLLILAHGDIIE